MNKQKRIKILKISAIGGILILIVLGVFYIRNIRIYEPILMDFEGISSSQENSIILFSITPLNRKIHQWKGGEKKGWKSYGYYHKRIGIMAHDSIIQKIESINVYLNDTVYSLKNEDLITIDKQNNYNTYLFPGKINSSYKWGKVKKVIVNADIIKYILVGLIFIFLLIILIPKFSSLRKNDFKMKSKKILPVIRLIAICMLIAAGLFYGYLFIKYSLASFFTSFFILFLCFLMCWYVVINLIKWFKLNNKVSKRLKITVVAIFIVFLVCEILLRICGINTSYNEDNNLFYLSGFKKNEQCIDESDNSDNVYARQVYSSFKDKRKEFTYNIKTNRDGLRDVDHSVEKPENQYRIICIGDSFTEGIGASIDSTWPALLEHELSKITTKKKVNVFNAGISSSDIFYGYYLLKNKMLKYSPDMVLLALSSSDYDFYGFRGGFERFSDDGVQYRDPPWWERLYAASYIFRFVLNTFMGYDGVFSPEEQKEIYREATNDIYKCICDFKGLAEKEKLNLILVFVDDQDTVYFPLKEKIKKENILPVIDLFEYTNNELNLTKEDREKLYWEIDGHCNSNGYHMFAKGIVWNFNKLGITDTLSP
jgi:hypothetical protein